MFKKSSFILVGVVLSLSLFSACSHWRRVPEGRLGKTEKGLVPVAFTSRPSEPDDQEIQVMVDEVIKQVLGPKGLEAIIKAGDKVIIKTNIVAPNAGNPDEKGRGIITDPRIARHMAERVRAIIGTGGTADLKVVDATFNPSKNPSQWRNDHSFFYARLEKNGNGVPDGADYGYDINADGVLDGSSSATLVNLDSIDDKGRFGTTITLENLGQINILLPKILRTKQQALAQNPDSKDPYHDAYCDVLIGLPILKSHGIGGVTGALKLHYGFRWYFDRFGHSGTTMDEKTGKVSMPEMLDDYLVGQHMVRSYDFILMDCITGNRAGPSSPDQKNETPVDYILVNALTASKDPVAIDTVEALFGGYDPKSIGMLKKANEKGLGTNQPQRIHLLGMDAFGNHRSGLLKKYGEKDLYPFRDGWGVARVMHDFSAPTGVALSEPATKSADDLLFFYIANESRDTDTGLARVELIANGRIVAYKNAELKSSGTIEVKRSALPKGKPVTLRIAAWDKALNCSLSPKMMFQR